MMEYVVALKKGNVQGRVDGLKEEDYLSNLIFFFKKGKEIKYSKGLTRSGKRRKKISLEKNKKNEIFERY